MKISYKLTGIFLIFTLSLTMLFYITGLRNQKENFAEIARERIHHVKTSFHNLEERDTKILLAALEVIIQDPRLKQVYLGKNREKLYQYVQPLFRKLNYRYGITHFYFIPPDGQVFLRVHDKNIYGDEVKRISFLKARDTQKPSWEIELGKTAFALRAVMPYFHENSLIGYVELGEEINHFLEILKGETRSEFAIIADKKYLDRNDWKSARRVARVRDNWDDLDKHLIISSTTEDKMAERCFAESYLKRVEQGEQILDQLMINKQTFMCSGFDLTDAGGRHIGAVLSLTDMTEHIIVAEKANKSILRMAIIFFFGTFTAGILISRSITKPILRLAAAARAVGRGDLDQRVSVNSHDEIGQLGSTFNDMLERRKLSDEELRKHREVLASLVDERTHELRTANDSLTKEIMERQLAEAEAIRASQLAALGEMAAGVAHEINNPINGIMNYTQILANSSTPGSREQDIANRIIKESNRIANIVRRLLSFARDSNEDMHPVHIHEIIDDSLALTEAQLRKDGIKLQVKVPSDLPVILARPQQIEQVFLNIMSNARYALNQKFAGIHEDKILEIRAQEVIMENRRNIQITFYDRGTGISSEILDKVINPFFTTKPSNVGTGLGLSISHGIISDHGGRLLIKSAEEAFTEVIIILPIA